MEYVPIVPLGAESLLTHPGVKRIFCFADLLETNKRYQEFYSESKQEVLLDHPIYELMPALDLFQTLALIQTYQPHITTIPDKHEDYTATTKMFYQYAPAMYEVTRGTRTRLMGVPQGTTYEMILANALLMLDTGQVDILGIGIKRSIPDLKRSQLVKDISRLYPKMRYHLLGARWPYHDEQLMAHDERVESCDTAEPVNAALNGVKFLDAGPEDVRRATNFQTLGLKALEGAPLVWSNISMMLQILRGNVILGV